jgi:hypothetical protein
LAVLGLGCAAVLAAAGTYVGLADAGSAVPGGDLVRRRLDRLGVTVFRPVPSRDAMAVAADRARREIRARVVAALRKPAIRRCGKSDRLPPRSIAIRAHRPMSCAPCRT